MFTGVIHMQPKYTDIAQMVVRRIEQGDYATDAFPSARKLASDVGVSYLTARKAIAYLADNGQLQQLDNGRMQIVRPRKSKRHEPRFAFIMPALESFAFLEWLDRINTVVEAMGGSVRPVGFVHGDDKLITETLGADFDGFFLIPPPELSPLLRQQLQRMVGRVIVMWYDLTEMGHPRLDGGAFANIDNLVEHFQSRGCRRIDCLCTQTMRSIGSAELRIVQWRQSLEQRGLEGRLWRYDQPETAISEWRAYELTQRMLSADDARPDAMFCVTAQPVQGVYRALYEADVQIGRDIALGTFGAPERCRLMIPSLTTINASPTQTNVDMAVKWLLADRKPPLPSLHMEPEFCEVIIGESSGSFTRKNEKK
jgi:DNA-binding LacI/PurR family transcriptional regulator